MIKLSGGYMKDKYVEMLRKLVLEEILVLPY